ncbi:MAG: hypothetical protein SFV20_11545 [Sphingopyxis sp.]|nr:hypothetical protein [Sphingopyxis sp.]
MKLLLALLAILTGLTGGEAVRVAAAAPSALGAAAVLAEASVEAGARIAGHRPVQGLPSLFDSACSDAPPVTLPAPSDFTPRGLRALE